MPCRAANICRQAPQCLWITDDVLAEAFDRFARVSNAQRRRAEGRRYGSNVPGPLEAHRRSTKRRMGVAAVASSMPTPGIDLGALFGLGGFAPERRVDDWKWQPPGVQEKPKPKRWPIGVVGRKKEKWEAFLDVPEEASPEDQVQKSKQVFEELLQGKEKALHVRAEDVNELFGFLQAAENEPEACNTLRLAEWLISQDLFEANFSAFHELLLGKVRLQTLGDRELTSTISLLLKSANAAEHVFETASLLDALPSDGQLAQTCAVVTRISLEGVSPEQELPSRLGVWLRVLRAAQCLQGDHFYSPAWRRIYDILARRFPTITPLREHLSTLKRLDMSRVILRHWVPLISSHAQGDSRDMVATSAGYAKWLPQPQQHRPHIDSLLEDFEALRSKYTTRRERCSGFTSATQLIAVLHHHRIPYVELCRGLFDILMHSSSAGSVYRIFYGITHHARISIDNALAQKLVEYFLAKKSPDLAEKVFVATPALPLSACYGLPLIIAKYRACSSTRLWSMLQRLTPEDAVPSDQRGHPQNCMPPEHTDLVHLVAFYISRSPHMDPRSAYRRIWECYLFLRDRKAIIKPMMSRAFVTAGLIRPFKSLQKVSVTKFRYILMLVERYEGREVADKLDRLAWKMWNDKVLPGIHARDAFMGAAQNLGSLKAAQGDPNSVKTRLLAATKRFRETRTWLYPERKRAEFPNHDPFPGLARVETADANADVEAVEGQIAGYSPFVLDSNPKEAVHDVEKSGTSQLLNTMQDLSADGSSAGLTVPRVDAPRSGLGYTSAHSYISDREIDRFATMEAAFPSQESTMALCSATSDMPQAVTTSNERESPLNDSTFPALGASQTQPIKMLEQFRTSIRSDFDLGQENREQQRPSLSSESKYGATLSHWPRKEVRQRELLFSPAAALSDPSIEWRSLESGKHQTSRRLVLRRTPSVWKGVLLDDVTRKGDRDAEALEADFMDAISPHEEVNPASVTSTAESVPIIARSDDANRAVAATSSDELVEPDPIRKRLSWKRVSLSHVPDVENTPESNDQEAKVLNLISTCEPASNGQVSPAADHFDVAHQSAEGKTGSSNSLPSRRTQHTRSPRTLEGHVLMKTVEIQCWQNTIRPSPDSLSLKAHECLSWRRDSKGKHRLFVDWDDVWIKLSTARLEAIRYEREGKMDQAKALKRIIRAASEGKANFEDGPRERRPGGRRMGPSAASIRMVRSNGKS